MKKLFLSMALVMSMGLLMTSCGDDEKNGGGNPVGLTIGEVNVAGDITENTTWTANNVYTMTEKVWVNAGAELTIEPGTIIKANEKTDPTEAVALIVMPGAKISAKGTADRPIIFTTSEDDIRLDEAGNHVKGSLNSSFSGLWGGVVIMGKATADHKNEPATSGIEGVSATETRGQYGSTTIDNDNSGEFYYVSIRHGGAAVSGSSELNGLSLYSVGSGTTIHHVEAFGNADDGVEFFGGTVNTSYMLVSHCEDDGFDWDQGYSGKNQFWAVLNKSTADKGGELDGGEGDLSPNSVPTVANFTFIGNGTNTAFHFKSKTGGRWYNGLVHNFLTGALMESVNDESEITLSNITISGFDATIPAIYAQDNSDYTTKSYVSGLSTTKLTSITWVDGKSDIVPSATEAGSATTTPSGLVPANYRGAFDPASPTTWAQGWTRASELGLIN